VVNDSVDVASSGRSFQVCGHCYILLLLCESVPVYDEFCRRSISCLRTVNAFHIAPKSFDVLLITVFFVDDVTLRLAGMHHVV